MNSKDPLPKQKKRRISSVDVAKEAGVSQATVSRVFNKGKGISVNPQTIKKILQAAEKLNYRPSVLARSLQENSTKIIGIINGNFKSQFHMDSIDIFSRQLQEHGYLTLLLNLIDATQMDEVLPKALEYQVDGIILTSVRLASHLADECSRFDTPVVQFNRYSNNRTVDSVCLDNYGAGEEAAKLLLQTNHEKMAYITGDIESSTSRDRMEGYIKTLENAGRSLHGIYTGRLAYEAGQEAADFLLGGSKADCPDAVFCGTDIEAIGFIDTAREIYNVRIPEDISIIGFDDISIASWPQYNLTTFRQPMEKLVDVTLQTLFDAIHYEKEKVINALLPGELVMRGSVVKR